MWSRCCSIVFVNNMGAIQLTKNMSTSGRTKHVDKRFHFVEDMVNDKEVEIKYVRSESNLADMFTKNLGEEKFNEMRSKVMNLWLFKQATGKN